VKLAEKNGLTGNQQIVLESVFIKGEQLKVVAGKLSMDEQSIRQLLKEAILKYRKASKKA
jgi:hypothetical protein